MSLRPFPIAFAFAAAIFAGCASHPSRMAGVRAALSSPSYVVDTKGGPLKESNVTGKDKILFLSERARAYQLTGDHAHSTEDYLAAEAAYDLLDEKPVVSISTGATKGAAATVLNDLVIPYEGNAHERLMLYQLDAFNHLARLDWNAARACANNIGHFSEIERKRNDERIRAAEAAAEEDGRFRLSAIQSNAVFRTNLASQDSVSKAVTDAFQNGYAYYFDAFVNEIDGRESNALIGYRRVAEAAPGNSFAKRDIHRMKVLLGDEEPMPGDEAAPNVVVFFEEGYAPELQGFSFSFVTLPVKHTGRDHLTAGIGSVRGSTVQTGGNGGVAVIPLPGMTPVSAKLTFPYYPKESLVAHPSHPLVISEKGSLVTRTELAGDFRALAARAFADKFPYIATRAAFRAILKATATAVANEAARQRGNSYAQIFVWLGGLIFTQATELPDLRSWLLAPRFGQIARFRLEPGRHELSFSHDGLTGLFAIEVPEDGTTVIHVMSVPGRLVVEGTALDFQDSM